MTKEKFSIMFMHRGVLASHFFVHF